jgi:hypothetical protein
MSQTPLDELEEKLPYPKKDQKSQEESQQEIDATINNILSVVDDLRENTKEKVRIDRRKINSPTEAAQYTRNVLNEVLKLPPTSFSRFETKNGLTLGTYIDFIKVLVRCYCILTYIIIIQKNTHGDTALFKIVADNLDNIAKMGAQT